jgi:dephospho-CoA kinase
MTQLIQLRRATPEPTIFVGLTGGIGAGKSTALAALERLGCSVLSADQVVHEVQADSAVVDILVERFGDIVAPEGAVDRAALASAAFADSQSREWLEGVIWPRVGARISQWRDRQVAQPPVSGVAVIEVPLLFESGMETLFDRTLCVVSEDSTRMLRAGQRGQAALEEREARQISQEEKASRCDFTVHNDGSVEELEHQLSAVLGRLAG